MRLLPMFRFWFYSFIILLYFSTCQIAQAQSVYLEIKGTSETETEYIDSLSYQKSFSNAKALQDEVNLLSEKLFENGFLHHKIKEPERKNDSTFLYRFQLHHRISKNIIRLEELDENTKKIIQLTESQIEIPIEKTASFLQNILQILEKKGYAVSQAALKNHQIIDHKLQTDLVVFLDEQRHIDLITIQPYTRFPKGIKKQLEKKYVKRPFNQQTISEIQQELTQYPFIRTTQSSEVLFTENKTVLYLYQEKHSVSRFDGLIGFANNEDDGKIRFNGNVDLQLINLFNLGEQFTIFWKNDGNQQSTFKFNTELPYLMNSPFGISAQIDIFKQDSTQQNARLEGSLLYYISYNNRVGLGYQNTTSVAGAGNLFGAEDFKNQFFTASYNYRNFRDHFLFPMQTQLTSKFGYGARSQESTGKINQQFLQFLGEHIFYLNPRNLIHTKLEAYHLFSEQVLFNELYRFGGIHSIRGFNENSLLAQTLGGLYAEYRYLLSGTIYAHSITDVAYYFEPLSNFRGTLYSFGAGIGIQTPGGLFNLVYANGVQPNTEFKLSNSVVHLSYKTQF